MASVMIIEKNKKFATEIGLAFQPLGFGIHLAQDIVAAKKALWSYTPDYILVNISRHRHLSLVPTDAFMIMYQKVSSDTLVKLKERVNQVQTRMLPI